jgi:DNA topoisomerase-2
VVNEIKEQKALKKQDGIKVKTLRDLTKLLDAGFAGTSKSSECMLIICEGDSAKAGITSGLSTEDRKRIGVYPLKGKILNVRGETLKKINDNKEIHELKRILGLEIGKTYENIEEVNKYLRYSKVIFMTDQDLDGSHIKGLCINLFQSEWVSLTRIPGFIGFMNTPILKARRGNNELRFYNQGEYDNWKKENTTSSHLWNIKYYKGLGTSTDMEFREYFKESKIVSFIHEGETSDDVIDLVFNKKRSEDRKQWLEKYDRDCYVNTSKTHVSYSEFVNKELIHFSKYDCDRSIPNIMDGLKMSLRKILYSAFKKNLTKDIKVAQFSGYVSEHSGYHHGEASLNAAIVGMSQNYVGSNNINLLVPNGQFGSRLMGGKDSASERYIFTRLNNITRKIFPDIDDHILTYLNDDGNMVEPVYYAPIIPLVLVNGCKGIGTGFSTNIPCYDPILLIQYLKSKIMGCVTITENEFIPYYDGFTGTIVKVDDKYVISGKYEIIDKDKICITELPVGTWTEDYKIFLEELTQSSVDKNGNKIPSIIKDYEDLYTKTKVNFPIIFNSGKLSELTHEQIMKMFKLTSTISIKNMHLFDSNDCLKKYETITNIIDEYFLKRLDLYILRKQYLIDMYQKQLLNLANKARYILAILNDEIDLRRKKYSQVVEMLTTHSYDLVNDSYDYLIKMPMDSVTDENVNKILKERDNKQRELNIIIDKSEFEMWNEELDILLQEYIEYKKERETENNPSVEKEKVTKIIKKKK